MKKILVVLILSLLFLSTYADIVALPPCKPWQEWFVWPAAVCDPSSVNNDNNDNKVINSKDIMNRQILFLLIYFILILSLLISLYRIRRKK
jgi:hypothetical protein